MPDTVHPGFADLDPADPDPRAGRALLQDRQVTELALCGRADPGFQLAFPGGVDGHGAQRGFDRDAHFGEEHLTAIIHQPRLGALDPAQRLDRRDISAAVGAGMALKFASCAGISSMRPPRFPFESRTKRALGGTCRAWRRTTGRAPTRRVLPSPPCGCAPGPGQRPLPRPDPEFLALQHDPIEAARLRALARERPQAAARARRRPRRG